MRVRPANVSVGRTTTTRLRIQLLSDTHGFVDPRIARIADRCHAVVHAGDIGNRDVLNRLRPRGGQVHAVRGNNDTAEKWPGRQRGALRRLPGEARLALPGGMLVVVHGDRVTPAHERHARLRLLYPDARAVLYGHTHRAVCDLDRLPWVLNPGAAGRSRTFGGPSCLVLDAGPRVWRVELLRFPPPLER